MKVYGLLYTDINRNTRIVRQKNESDLLTDFPKANISSEKKLKECNRNQSLQTLTLQLVTVFDSRFPITHLAIHVEGELCWTANGRQPDGSDTSAAITPAGRRLGCCGGRCVATVGER